MDKMNGMALLIPIVAIVFSLSIPIVAMITDSLNRRRIYEMYHKERLAAIEKGVEIPPLPADLIDGVTDRPKKPRYLLKGMIWLLVGLTSLTALYYDPRGRDYALYALIPAGVGIAYLLYYALAGRKEEEQAGNTQDRRTL